MSFKLKTAAFLLALALSLSLTACGKGEKGTPSDNSAGNNSSSPLTPTVDPDMFDEQDEKTEVDENTATKVTLDGKTLTIGKAGEYVIAEKITGGQLIVDTDKNSEVHLVLKGVSITSEACPAIYLKKAKKVIITLAEGTENSVEMKGGYAASQEDSLGGAIYSKCDLTLNGKGSLKVTANYGDAVVSKDNLIIAGGSYEVTAAEHAFDGNDSLRVSSGSFKVKADGDGFHVENVEDTTLGFFYASGGDFDITSSGDGIAASGYLKLDGGNYKILAGDGSASVNLSSSQNDFGFGRWDTADDSADTLSQKGIKAGGDLQIAAGKFSIDSADDAIHANGNVTVSGGEGIISSGDDGIHADNALTLAGGKYDIKKSYEGLEGLSITVSKGEYSLVSYDDGLNAAGGNDQSGFGGYMPPDMFGSSSDSFVKISGGCLSVNASGDGIDSNGDFTVSGGEVYVSGPTNSGNGFLDYGGTAKITGGIFFAAGSAGMAQNFSSSSTQGAILVNLASQKASTIVNLTDSKGKVLCAHAFEKTFSTVLVSTPDIKVGETYTVTAEDSSETVEMTSLIYGSTGFGGGMGGGPGGMRPGQRW